MNQRGQACQKAGALCRFLERGPPAFERYHLVRSANLRYTLDWYFCADVKSLVSDLSAREPLDRKPGLVGLPLADRSHDQLLSGCLETAGIGRGEAWLSGRQPGVRLLRSFL